MGASREDVRESLGRLRAAAGEDTAAAVCEVQGVRRAFSAAIKNLALRTGELEAELAALDRSRPLLLPFDEPEVSRWRITKARTAWFWMILGVLCLVALATGFMVGRAR